MIIYFATEKNGTISDLITQIEWAIIYAPEQSVRAIMSAIDDDPIGARRAGIGNGLIDLSCGLDWDCRSDDVTDYGLIYALPRLRAICRFLNGNDIKEENAMRPQAIR